MSYHSKDAYEVPGKLEIPFRYYAGKTGSIFLTTLRDHQKFMATRCDKCNIVFMPPRSVCNACYRRIDDWKEVGPAGIVITFTVVRYSEPHLAAQPPYVLALIKLDGADTAMAHIVAEIPPEQVKIGMRVEPVFAEDRKARITDVAYFRPAGKEKSEKKAPRKKAAKRGRPKKTVKKAAAKKAVKKAAQKRAGKPGRKPKKKTLKKAAAKKAVKKPAPEKPGRKKRATKSKKK